MQGGKAFIERNVHGMKTRPTHTHTLSLSPSALSSKHILVECNGQRERGREGGGPVGNFWAIGPATNTCSGEKTSICWSTVSVVLEYFCGVDFSLRKHNQSP